MNKRYQIVILMMLIAVLFIAVACSNETEQALKDKPEQENNNTVENIVITGVESGEESISIKEIKDMEAVTKEMESISSSGEINNNKVKGVLLEKILNQHGTSQKNYGGIRFIAGDGYSIVIPKEVLQLRDIVLAYEIDDEELDKKSLPLRVTVPDERAMYWVRNLAKIELIEEEILTMDKIFFLETAIDPLNHEDYTYYESKDMAVKGMEIIENYSENKDYKGMYFKAIDGLEKKEDLEVFKDGYVKVTGKDTPLFLSPELPKGMHIKDILWFSHGNTGYFSIESGFKAFDKKEIEENSGIYLKEIIKETDFQKKNKYLCKASDGYEVEISDEDIDKGYIYARNKGGYTLAFEGLQKNTKIKNILSIESIK